jgi:hypothetical protein
MESAHTVPAREGGQWGWPGPQSRGTRADQDQVQSERLATSKRLAQYQSLRLTPVRQCSVSNLPVTCARCVCGDL